MRDVDFHRSRRVGQLPFLPAVSTVRALSLHQMRLVAAVPEAAPNSAPA
jgi:hypothetical protein